MTFPTNVAAGELIESAWGNTVVAHLPAFLGTVTNIAAGNVPPDGVGHNVGSGFAIPAPVAGWVVVQWSLHYAGSVAPGRINPALIHGATVGQANQSFAAADFGTVTVLGYYGVALGELCTVQFNVTLTGTSANVNVDGYAAAFMFGNL